MYSNEIISLFRRGVFVVRSLAFLLTVIVFQSFSLCDAEDTADEVFSGPQPGEVLPSLRVEILDGDRKGQEVDLVKEFGARPNLLIFVHELTRPGFGLMRTISQFASSRFSGASERKGDTDASGESKVDSIQDIQVGVVFLTADKSETIRWATGVKRLFSPSVLYAVSPDGIAGPGAFGLNRNVTLTALVSDQGKVTKNFALIQPQLQADGPKMIEAIVQVTGGGDVPTLASLMGEGYGMRRMKGKPDSDSEGRPSKGEVSNARPQTDPQLAAQFRPMISKTASESEVEKRALRIERYLELHPEGKKEIARIVNTIIRSGKLENYGTTAAQRVLKRWQKQYEEFAPAETKTPE